MITIGIRTEGLGHIWGKNRKELCGANSERLLNRDATRQCGGGGGSDSEERERIEMNDRQALGTNREPSAGVLSFAGVSIGLTAADQVSKSWIRTKLALGQSIPESGFARLVHWQNDGGVFGLFPDNNLALSVVAIGLVVGMLVAFTFAAFRDPRLCECPPPVFFGMLFGGAAGNLIDRVRLGPRIRERRQRRLGRVARLSEIHPSYL